ncbi:MAG: hypothetical protein JRE13_17235 [Deltaproteobacteria bacterium]|nr:hypothetical protein [Deltaproteobacteria bacterium]
MTRTISLATCFTATVALLLGAADARAGTDSCREWQKEHCEWKARAVKRYLGGAPQRELDEAVFEILQLEAYLTSCDVSGRSARNTMVGWRLVDRATDEFSSAVIESVLERSGFDVGLRSRLSGVITEPERHPTAIANTAMRTSQVGPGGSGAAR